MREERIVDEKQVFDWIERVFERGVRRPGYPADRFAEAFSAERVRELGLEDVRLEPVSLPYWEPRSWSLHVSAQGEDFEVRCFPLPHAAPCDEIELELAEFAPGAVAGRAALFDVPMLRIPPAAPASGGSAFEAIAQQVEIGLRPGGRVLDPRKSFADTVQVLPFGAPIQAVMEPSIEAGAAAFIGMLSAYPGGGCDYYVPYDGIERGIPGVWIGDADGVRLRGLLERGPVRVRLRVDSVREPVECHNVVGELPGADDELVVIGSHHDGPWSSAVEDGTGIALVLAQAAYWAQVPREERPHRMLFLLNAGHMVGGAGVHGFIDAHQAELERIVLELHLEHAAAEFVERDGELVATGEPEPRWFFTSRIPRLEAAVADALEREGVDRSLIVAPDAFGPQPTTDGGAFYPAGVPLVNYLTAPFYLFDRMDTLDKVHRPSLLPVTRAAIRILESTAGVSAAQMRAERARPSSRNGRAASP
jgi:hypothetical protein